MTLQELCKAIGALGHNKLNEKTCIKGITLDSRKVIPGFCFFAVAGYSTDGHQYIQEAIKRGAVVIVTEKDLSEVESFKNTVWIQVADIRKALAQAARAFYCFPDRFLEVVGVTGTNGKTTVSCLIHYFLKQFESVAGLLGTIHYDVGSRTLPSSKTTPEASDVYELFSQMVAYQCKRVVMEISSHALTLKRIYGLEAKIGVFLNLTRDHLDFHQDMENYYQSKLKLFNGENGSMPKIAVVNVDDSYGKRLVEDLPKEVEVLTFGLKEARASLRATEVKLAANGLEFQLIGWGERPIAVKSALLGYYNVSNILAAFGVAKVLGLKQEFVAEELLAFQGVPGRMQPVSVGQSFNVLVDYAHTDDALENALKMLREITSGRLLVVFGCGGNRDRQKRGLMTAAVQRYADFTFATSDNPRHEAQSVIFEDMKEGVLSPSTIAFISERRLAIYEAIKEARSGDCVLIAGKGHEAYQIVEDTVFPFDDALVAEELLTYRFKGEKALGEKHNAYVEME